ncbi:hypothetical protein [Streptacidiphilus sp. PAMC 29251]
MRRTLTVTIGAATLVLAACSSTTNAAHTAAAPAGISAPAHTAAPIKTTAAPATSFAGDGEFQVGKDIAPGTYKSAGPASTDLPSCYWERDKDASGNMDSIIANDTPTGAAVVTIKFTDRIFKTQGCKQWTKAG